MCVRYAEFKDELRWVMKTLKSTWMPQKKRRKKTCLVLFLKLNCKQLHWRQYNDLVSPELLLFPFFCLWVRHSVWGGVSESREWRGETIETGKTAVKTPTQSWNGGDYIQFNVGIKLLNWHNYDNLPPPPPTHTHTHTRVEKTILYNTTQQE